MIILLLLLLLFFRRARQRGRARSQRGKTEDKNVQAKTGQPMSLKRVTNKREGEGRGSGA